MKRILLIALVSLTMVAAAFVATIWFEVYRAPQENRGEVLRFEIVRGMPFVLVAQRLERAGLIRNARPIRIYAMATGHDRKIHQGVYEFTIGERPVDILRRMSQGDILVVTVTIPEGFNKWQIAGAFAAAGVDSLGLYKAIHSPAVRERREIPVASLEGYLFPDTYQIPFGARPEEVVEQMLGRLDDVFGSDLLMLAAERDMIPHEVLTLASIVEAESRVPSERPLVSAVYHNRLARGMRLEADPTVAYAMGGYRGRLLYKDLEIDSPYNTYRHRGLPPGPICSPGEASIRAAMDPDPELDALYFVARGDGSHVFTRTIQEHNEAVRKLRSVQREQRRSQAAQESEPADQTEEKGHGSAHN